MTPVVELSSDLDSASDSGVPDKPTDVPQIRMRRISRPPSDSTQSSRKRRRSNESAEHLDATHSPSSSEDEVEIINTTREAIDKSLKHKNTVKSLKDVRCPVCLSDIDESVVTPCGHLFCADCLYQALPSSRCRSADSGVCPMCRKQVKLREVTHLMFRVQAKT